MHGEIESSTQFLERLQDELLEDGLRDPRRRRPDAKQYLDSHLTSLLEPSDDFLWIDDEDLYLEVEQELDYRDQPWYLAKVTRQQLLEEESEERGIPSSILEVLHLFEDDVEFLHPIEKKRGVKLADFHCGRRRRVKKLRQRPWSKERRDSIARHRWLRSERRTALQERTGYFDLLQECEELLRQEQDREELGEFIAVSTDD